MDDRAPADSYRPTAGLWALLLLALAIRLAWMWTHSATIENEGAEYCRLAENLLNGRGYFGVEAAPGLQLNFPPLFPLLIAGVSLLAGNTELAGRLVTLISGLCLIWAVFLIARRLYGERVAYVAAAAATIHPIFIAFSTSIYSEGPYLALLFFGMYGLMCSSDNRSLRSAIVSGAVLGLAYLTRPEGLLFTIVLLVPLVVVGFWRVRAREALRSAAVIAGVALLVGSPYIYFLSSNTGQLLWQGKGALILAIGQRMNAGMSYGEAVNGIDDNLVEQGVHIRPMGDVIRTATASDLGSLSTAVDDFAGSAARNVGPLFRRVTDSHPMGAPVIVVLVLLGLLRSAWSRNRVDSEMFLLVLFSVSCITVLGALGDFRYLLTMFTVMMLWAAKGADELGDWAGGTLESVALGRFARFGTALTAIAVLAMSGIALRTLDEVGELSQSGSGQFKTVGLWLRQHHPNPGLIMGTGLAIPYYAGADLWPLPYASSAVAVRYVEKKNPSFVVLQSGAERPYMAAWAASGIPSPKAREVHRSGPAGDQIIIYEWNGSPGPSAGLP